jgi:mannose-1-phosphate guanylyltransferase
MYDKQTKIRPVLLSGGSGTRLLPVSRSKAPKQFVPLVGEEYLFAATICSVADDVRYAPRRSSAIWNTNS